MTAGGDFIPGGDFDDVEEPKYPVVFGFSLTPTVNGVLIALAGLGLAGYLLLNVVQPAWQRNQELKQDVAAKEQQLRDQGETERQIAEARLQLAEAKKLQADVLTLFATEESLNTLLLDVNERVQAANARIANPELRAKLVRFSPEPQPETLPDGRPGDTITDSSYGAAVNNRLRRRVINVEIQGSFAQIQSIIRNIERLQPLLVVQDLRSELVKAESVQVNRQGRLVTVASDARLKTTFKLIALVPAEAPPPAAPAAPADGAAPSPAP